MMDNTKLVIVIVLILLSAAATVYLFMSQQEVAPEKFFMTFLTADEVAIVVDLTKVSNAEVKRNMLQCGTDYIFSSGQLISEGKLSYYIIEGSVCYPSYYAANDSQLISDVEETTKCKAEYLGKPYLLIIPGSSVPKFYNSHSVVSVDETYEYGQCSLILNS